MCNYNRHHIIQNHIKPNIGDIPIEKLSSLTLQKLYRKLLTEGRVPRIEAEKQPKGLSTKTVRNIHQVISSAMGMAVKHRLILSNPAEGCELPSLEHKEMHTIHAEQLGAFLREARDSGVYELYCFTLDTYAHVTTAAQKEAAYTMGSVLNV